MTNARDVFDVIDTMDVQALGNLLACDATMVFGNGEPLTGKDAILAGCEEFSTTVQGWRHHILNEWTAGPDTITETEVTYTRLDAKEVTVPVVSIWRTQDDGLIRDYRVFFDLTPVYAP